jgi:hypothetical protein
MKRDDSGAFRHACTGPMRFYDVKSREFWRTSRGARATFSVLNDEERVRLSPVGTLPYNYKVALPINTKL